jgi:hypothetical protein
MTSFSKTPCNIRTEFIENVCFSVTEKAVEFDPSKVFAAKQSVRNVSSICWDITMHIAHDMLASISRQIDADISNENQPS